MDKIKLQNDIFNSKKFVPFKNGLNNLGNTCYINSIMTCLFQIEEFLLNFGDRHISSVKTHDYSIFQSLHHLIISNYENKDTLDMLTEEFVDRIMKKRVFQRYLQNCANEYFIFLLQWLEEDLHKILNTNISQADRFTTNQCNNFLKNEFKIKLLRTIICSKGGGISQTHSDDVLVLDIVDRNGRPLRDLNACIEEYFKPLTITCTCPYKNHQRNNNSCVAYKCDRCNDYVDATIELTIRSLPNVLSITFVIFNINMVSNC